MLDAKPLIDNHGICRLQPPRLTLRRHPMRLQLLRLSGQQIRDMPQRYAARHFPRGREPLVAFAAGVGGPDAEADLGGRRGGELHAAPCSGAWGGGNAEVRGEGHVRGVLGPEKGEEWVEDYWDVHFREA